MSQGGLAAGVKDAYQSEVSEDRFEVQWDRFSRHDLNSPGREQDVARFDIAVNDVAFVGVLQSIRNAGQQPADVGQFQAAISGM